MKYLLLFCFCIFTLLPLANAQQKYSLNMENVSLEEAIKAIEKITNYSFMFDNSLNLSGKVNIHKNDVLLKNILDEVFSKQNIKYDISGNQIVLTKIESDSKNTSKSKITGLVVDASNLPLIGANILIKGTSIGTTCGEDGSFSIEAPQGATLVVSYIGYRQKEILVRDRSKLDIVLESDANIMDELVVTALGIKREKKALGYAVQDIKGDVLNEVREPNMLNSLSGQIAGVQISNTGTGGLGGSPKVTIRGETSFTNNSPLFVVDGIPVSNNSSNFGTDGVDFGNGAGDINPSDIESVSVLKGPTAAALYGSRAGNGAIVITTKSGSRNKGLGITFNSSVIFQPWLLKTPDYQYRYGGGENFEYEYVDGKGGGKYDGSSYSWGPKLNQPDPSTKSGLVEIAQFGSPIDPSTGKRIPTPWIAHPNFLEDFFETGVILTNNIAVSNSNDKGDYRLSYTNMDQKGIMPNTDLKRNTVSLNTGYKLTDNFRINANVNYVQNTSDNMPQVNYWDKPIMYSFIWWGMNEDVRNLKNYWKPGRVGLEQDNFDNLWADNPYFTLYENTQSQLKNRIYGNISVNYEIIKGLTLMGRTGTDWYNENIQIKRAYSSRKYQNGKYAVNNYIFQERNSDFLLTWDKPLNGDFQYKVSVGGNKMRRSTRNVNATAAELSIPGLYNLENSKSAPEIKETNTEKEVNSLYSTGQISYKNMLYMDVTARNDWSSALPSKLNSFFYPSISMSGVLSEMIKLPELVSFAKVRGSWAQVGNDTDPHQLLQTYSFVNKWGNISTAEEKGLLLNSRLKPEKINSIEFGIDLRFFKNRILLDVAYYNTIATNQILSMSIASSSGYDSRMINAGKIESRGVEVMLNTIPVKTKDFEWSMIYNWSMNRSYVRELAEGILSYDMGYNAQARVGERMGDLYGWGFKHAPDGQFIYKDGLPVWEDEIKQYGNYNPDWMLGFKNIFSYKRWKFMALLDYRKGGRIYSGTMAKGMEAGVLAESAIGDQREEGLIGEGVMEQGNIFVPNNVRVGLRDWIGHYHRRSAFETNSFDASYVKLRELSLSYTIPQVSITDKYALRNISVSLVARNLWMWAKAKHIDPESGGYGYEDTQIPTPKNIGFNLSVSF